jgi:hypothetical protein
MELLQPLVRGRLRGAATLPWQAPALAGAARRVEGALRREATAARRARDGHRLQRAEALLDALGGGLTAGEGLLVAAAAAAPSDGVARLLGPLLRRPRRRVTLVPRIAGVVRVVSFRA